MSEELLQEIEDYLEMESFFTGKKGKLVGYDAEDYDESKEYNSLYEGGNYVFDVRTSKYYYCHISYDEEGE